MHDLRAWLMELVHEFDLHADLGDTLVPGAGPMGTRLVAPVEGGWVKGERINGTLVGPGADWVTVGPDGYGRIDVRLQVLTDDGVVLYVTYTGVLEMTDALVAATMGDGTTDFDDQYFRTTPRLETGDERYAWVNSTIFIARGRITESGVEYEVFRVT
jgi:hypothetical protein